MTAPPRPPVGELVRGVPQSEGLAWPAWVVPIQARGEWLALQVALALFGEAVPCRRDPERWYHPNHRAQAAIVRECDRCPVLEACREYACAADEREGVWGGLPAPSRGVRRRELLERRESTS